jgi:hemerythrin superfamily protein
MSHSNDEVDMATTKKTKGNKAAERKAPGEKTQRGKSSSEKPTAVELLEEDHREVEGYFDEYQELEDDEAKSELAVKICLALKVHTQIEEEIFYPQARKATKDDDLLDEAAVEHAGAKHLISEIEEMEVGDDLYDAKIKVLGEQIKQHVKEEEDELFPEAKSAKMDLEGLGEKLASRKAELMAEFSGESMPVRAVRADRATAGDKPTTKRE